jgi:Helix-turn-helix domain
MNLPIRQTLNLLPISRTHRAVLIEVCELAEQKHGACTASNGYLGQRLLASERTVSRVLCELVSAGLLCCEGEGRARRLVASDGLSACYSEGQNLDKLARLNLDNLDNLDKKPRQSSQNGEVGEVMNLDNLDKNADKPSQVAHTNLANRGSQPSQVASRVLGDDHDDQLTVTTSLTVVASTLPTTFAATAAPLEAEVERLKDLLSRADARLAKAADTYRADQSTIAGLRAELAAKVAPPPAPKRPAKPVAEPDPATSLLIGVYRDWFVDRFKAQPNIRPMDGKAAKDAAAYLRSLADTEAPDVNAAAAEVLQGLLRGWETYETYLRKQTTLAQICGNLTNLIAARHQPLTVSQPNASTSGPIHPAPQRQPTSGPQSRYNAPSVNGNYGKL